MTTILITSLSGSSMLMIYWLLSTIFKRHLSTGLRYILLRCSLLYFLIPLPFLKPLYRDIYNILLGLNPYAGADVAFDGYDGVGMVIVGNGGMAINNYYIIALVLLLVWFIGGVIMLVREFKIHRYHKRQILKRTMWMEGSDRLGRWEAIQKEYGIKRTILYSVCAVDISPLTYGLFRPEIVLPHNLAEDAEEMVIRHELAHVKQLDVLTRILTILCVSFHWFNPFIYRLKSELYRQCELSCDEKAIRGMDIGSCHSFAGAILNNAVKVSPEKAAQRSNLSMDLSKEGEKIEERVIRIMEKKVKRPRSRTIAMSILVVVVVLLNSLTVMAYDDVRMAVVEQESQEDVYNLSNHGWKFQGGDTSVTQVDVLSDTQFVDEDGNIYEIGENKIKPRGLCSHTFVAGSYMTHQKFSDGSCTVKYYNGEFCTKCTLTIIRDLYMTTIYVTCGHGKG